MWHALPSFNTHTHVQRTQYKLGGQRQIRPLPSDLSCHQGDQSFMLRVWKWKWQSVECAMTVIFTGQAPEPASQSEGNLRRHEKWREGSAVSRMERQQVSRCGAGIWGRKTMCEKRFDACGELWDFVAGGDWGSRRQNWEENRAWPGNLCLLMWRAWHLTRRLGDYLKTFNQEKKNGIKFPWQRSLHKKY